MPQTIVKTTTVYSLEELEALGWHVYQDAISNVITWGWEGFEPSWYSDDIKTLFEEEYPQFYLHENSLEWDMDRTSISFQGTIDLLALMRHLKLCNKYRSFFYGMNDLRLERSVVAKVGRDIDFHDVIRDIECYIERKPQQERMVEQAEAFASDVQDWFNGIYGRLKNYLRAEYDYRNSAEYAKEEAEANELKFTEAGTLYRG